MDIQTEKEKANRLFEEAFRMESDFDDVSRIKKWLFTYYDSDDEVNPEDVRTFQSFTYDEEDLEDWDTDYYDIETYGRDGRTCFYLCDPQEREAVITPGTEIQIPTDYGWCKITAEVRLEAWNQDPVGLYRDDGAVYAHRGVLNRKSGYVELYKSI